MKILFLSRRFYPDIGGVENHVLEIGKKLVLKGHKVVVATTSQGKEKKIEGIEIVRLPKTSNKREIWKWFFENRDLIKDSDIVHAHDVYFWYFPFRLFFPFKKSFVTFHGYESYPIKKKTIMIRKLSEYLASGNIIVGDFIKKWYGTKPNYVTYGAVEISNFQFPISNKIKKESAVFIGRLDEQTGILDYAKAVKLIRKEIPQFEFTILGDGKFKAKLQEYKPLGFKRNPFDYLKNHNFAFVSRYLSILEAIASKRLVFAVFDNPVKEDYLRMSPFAKFIVIENNSSALSKKIIFYLENTKKADKLIEEGYRWVKNQTWDNMVRAYLDLWEI